MKTNKGFTLIELLVVIAIIGVLASVVLASLSSAKTKGADSKIKSQLSNMRSQALLYNGSSTGVSARACLQTSGNLFDSVNGGLYNLFPKQNGTTSIPDTGCASAAGLPSAGAKWAVAWPLSSGYFCVDSTGSARSTGPGGFAYNAAIGTAGTTASGAAITTYSCN